MAGFHRCPAILLLSLVILGCFSISQAQPQCQQSNIRAFSYANEGLSSPTFTFVGKNSQGVIAKLSNGQFIYSVDGGVTFTEHRSFTSTFDPVVSVNGSNILMRSSIDANKIYISRFSELSPYEGRFSVFEEITLPFDISSFVPHPSFDHLLLAMGKTLDCRDFANRLTCYSSLYFSNDFGRTWVNVLPYIASSSFDWTIKATYGHRYGFIAQDYEDKSGGQVGKNWFQKRLVYGDLTDLVERGINRPAPSVVVWQQSVVASLITKGLIFAAKLRAPDAVPLNPLDIRLYTSHDGGASFKIVRLPNYQTLAERRYTILDVSGGSVFVNVERNTSSYGNIYSSDENGDRYAINLRFNSKSRLTSQADFAPVQSIDGIYLANYETSPGDLNSDLGSVISFDRGGQWFRLKAPQSEISSCQDTQDCHLNLHAQSTSSQGTSFYSHNRAVGVIIGNGNVGSTLNISSNANINTFISRDAGKSWTKAKSGEHVYSISQNGGIIVMARTDITTNKITWTSNEGRDWNECSLPDSIMELLEEATQNVQQQTVNQMSSSTIQNINLHQSESFNIDNVLSTRIEDSSATMRSVTTRDGPTLGIISLMSIPSTDASARFLIYARSQSKGYIIYLDFNATESRTCQGWDNPSSPNSDYEPWIPSDLDGDGCLLGQKIIYMRKKTSVNCWIGANIPPTIRQAVNCSCARQDYMCDYCFAPNITNPDICVPDCALHNPLVPPDPCEGTWRPSYGYRLVAGDKCTGGLDKLGPLLPCPPKTPVSAPTSVPVPPPAKTPVAAPPPVKAPVPINPPTKAPVAIPVPVQPPVQSPIHLTPTHTPSTPPHAQVPQAAKPRAAKFAIIFASFGLLILIGTIGTIYYLSSRNAKVRHTLMKCVPDKLLPAYVPPDREDGPRYHRLQGTGLTPAGDDIFNDDEFLQEDANVLDLDD